MNVRPWIAVGFILMIIACPVVFAGPDLIADSVNGPDWVPATDLSVSKAQCTRWQGIVSTCTIDYVGRSGSDITPQLQYFIYGSWARETARLLRSPKNPASITTVQAIRDLGARQTTMAVWLLTWLFLISWVLAAALLKRAPRDDRPPSASHADLAAAARASAVFASPASPQAGTPPTFGRRRR